MKRCRAASTCSFCHGPRRPQRDSRTCAPANAKRESTDIASRALLRFSALGLTFTKAIIEVSGGAQDCVVSTAARSCQHCSRLSCQICVSCLDARGTRQWSAPGLHAAQRQCANRACRSFVRHRQGTRVPVRARGFHRNALRLRDQSA